MYGVGLSSVLISELTDSIQEEVKVWQCRPLGALYPIVYPNASPTAEGQSVPFRTLIPGERYPANAPRSSSAASNGTISTVRPATAVSATDSE